MRRHLFVVFCFFLLSVNKGEERDVFGKSPFHSFVDDLDKLRNAFPELVVLEKVVTRGVEYLSVNQATVVPSLHAHVLGRGFHRTLRFELDDVFHECPVNVLIFQRLSPDVFVDPYELKNSKGVETQIVGPIDLESPATSSSPTLLFLKVTVTPEQTSLNFTVSVHAKYPEAISRRHSRKCDGDGDEFDQWMGCHVCVELDPPVAVVDTVDGSKFGIIIVSESAAKLTIPAGNAEHTLAVVFISFLALFAASAAVLWMLFAESFRTNESDRKIR